MIILEGCDGSGKTTLLRQMKNTLHMEPGPRASTSTGGPVEQLKRWVDLDMETWPTRECVVYDRYPLISEVIYRPVIDHTLRAGFDSPWLREATDRFRKQAFVIFCLPPLEHVLSNVQAEDQMPGVHENIEQLYWLYHVAAAQYAGQSVTFDYTKDPLATLLATAKQHKDRWY